MRIGLAEILLIESIIFAGVWVWNDYVGLILSLTISGIITAVLLISLAAERIERTRVPRKFFIWLFWTIFPPIIIGVGYTYLIDGQFLWLEDI